MNKKYFKKGDALVLTPMIVLFSVIIILILGMFFVNAIKPFIWYEKLNDIANKYMFVIEKFGYLTSKEKINLEKDLVNAGFDINKVIIEYPNSKKYYGEILEFVIKYNFEVKLPNFTNGISSSNKQMDLIVKKYSYSKI